MPVVYAGMTSTHVLSSGSIFFSSFSSSKKYLIRVFLYPLFFTGLCVSVTEHINVI